MRNIFTKSLVVLISCSLLAYADGNTFKVRYNGGSVASKVDPHDWSNKLSITADAITLDLKDKQSVVIAPKSVTSLSYGQEAHRRVGTMIALAVLVSPVALFGLMHKTRLHYIGIQYKTPDGSNAGILLQGDKDNYRAILVALQGVTGVPVSLGEKEREFVPVGINSTVTKETAEAKTESRNADPTKDEPHGTVSVSTEPAAAEVYVDGQFYGNSPATLKLKPGKHEIVVKMGGYMDWSKAILTESDSEAHLVATLEKLK
jgi:hypothetical protein